MGNARKISAWHRVSTANVSEINITGGCSSFLPSFYVRFIGGFAGFLLHWNRYWFRFWLALRVSRKVGFLCAQLSCGDTAGFISFRLYWLFFLDRVWAAVNYETSIDLAKWSDYWMGLAHSGAWIMGGLLSFVCSRFGPQSSAGTYWVFTEFRVLPALWDRATIECVSPFRGHGRVPCCCCYYFVVVHDIITMIWCSACRIESVS